MPISGKLHQEHDLQHADRVACLCLLTLLNLYSKKIALSSGAVLLLWEYSQGGHSMAARWRRETISEGQRGENRYTATTNCPRHPIIITIYLFIEAI